MTAPAEPPRYVYKIVDAEPPLPIPDVFPPSELDKKDGFIHLSAPWQVSQATGTTIITSTSTVTHCSHHSLPVDRPISSSTYLLKNPVRLNVTLPPRPNQAPFTDHRGDGKQLPVTADLFFSRHETLWVLKIRLASIEGSVRWEPPAGGSGGSNEGYPHLYGSLGRADVESVERFKRTADERGVFQNRWKDVFSDSRWRAWEEGKGMAVEE